MLSIGCWIFCWNGGFRHMTESDFLLFLIELNEIYGLVSVLGINIGGILYLPCQRRNASLYQDLSGSEHERRGLVAVLGVYIGGILYLPCLRRNTIVWTRPSSAAYMNGVDLLTSSACTFIKCQLFLPRLRKNAIVLTRPSAAAYMNGVDLLASSAYTLAVYSTYLVWEGMPWSE